MEEAGTTRERCVALSRYVTQYHTNYIHSCLATETAQKRQSSDESDDDSGVEVDSPRKKKHKKQVKKDKEALPDWTKDADAIV